MKLEINDNLINSIIPKALDSGRLRMNYNIHQSLDEPVQRLLNVLLPGTKIPIHRHQNTDETYILLRGRMDILFYSDNGDVIERYQLNPHKGEYGLNVPKGQWHTIEVISESAVFEVKEGPYKPFSEEDILEIETPTNSCLPEKRQGLSGIASQIDEDFVEAKSDGSHNFIIRPFIPWLRKSESFIESGEYSKSAEICACILEEIGYRYGKGEYWVCRDEFSPSDDVCLTAVFFISEMMSQPNISHDIRKEILNKMSSLTGYTYFSGKEEFDMKGFVNNGCIYSFPQGWKHI